MLKRTVAGLLCSVFAIAALAGTGIDVDSIAGVYKTKLVINTVSDGIIHTEDVLEIVKLAPDKVYFRTRLTFENGHMCTLWGVAKQEGTALVYRDVPDAGSPQCVLSIVMDGKRIEFRDPDGRCQSYCGARGVLNGSGFDLTSRRAIRYMKRLKNSRQFAQALEDAEIRQ